MTRSMAYHVDCEGLASCARCQSRLWNGKPAVVTPWADRLFNVFGGVVIALAFVYLLGHIVAAVAQ